MQTALPPAMLATPAGRRADEILRACVHCGFCNATCPTYLLTGNELDGPRGRIYLIKQALEAQHAGDVEARYLDRCLTCRACETTCPSGVAYGELAEIGRDFVERHGNRPFVDRVLRALLVAVIPHRRRFRGLARLGHAFRFLLPRTLAAVVPEPRPASPWSTSASSQRVILLEGCVQSVATPAVNAALSRVLARMGIEAVRAAHEGCCGSLALHLGAEDTARAHMRRNALALYGAREGVDAIVSSASGCGVTLKDYGRHLGAPAIPRGSVPEGPETAAVAAQWVAAHTLDASEYLLRHVERLPRTSRPLKVAFQSPCTLQHGSRVRGAVEAVLARAGHTLVPVADGHLCCGSAGTYAFLEPTLAGALRERKLAALTAASPDVIATANVGCALHLAAASSLPVRHWIELLD
jgi:glycolate oxidase iron-sulfur subunit